MTPQLQQAIKLLQLSSLDLQQEIQQVLDSNMMLEVAEDEGPFGEVAEPPAPAADNEFRELADMDAPADIPAELPVDSSWEEVYDTPQNFTAGGDGDSDDYLLHRAPAQSLQDYLVWQMELAHFSERDYAIATAIVDSVNDDGYLTSPIEEIHEGLASQIPDLELDEVKAVLHRIQSFDPAGIAAADLADCLRIQLSQMPDDTPWRDRALELVSRYLDLLAKKDLNKLKKLMNLEDGELNGIITLIRSLEPKPGRQITPPDAQYIIPDVFIVRQGDQWAVTLNPEIAPRLRINPFYSNMIRRADSSSDNVTMKNHLQEARWFIKSLQSRNETLLKVARCIIERQKDFLDHGETAMKPLVLRDIAEAVEMHESTISRVTTQKYIHTPNGVYEFKYFFSSHVSTDTGGECSATAIKAYLKEIIDGEDPAKPLSDDVISKLLKDRGIKVARRTIAKYREAMSIPPSNERRRVF